MTATGTIKTELEHIAELQEAERRLHGRLETVRTGITERVRKVQEALEAGGTTGDRLRDLVIRYHGLDDEELLKKYDAVQQALAGKKSQFVLVWYWTKVPCRHVFGQGYEDRDARYFRLGVLEDEQLVWVENNSARPWDFSYISLPVSRFIGGEITPALFRTKVSDEMRKVRQRNILSRATNEGDPKPLDLLLGEEELGWVVIGDEAVRKWLEEYCMPGLFKPAADALGKLILEPTD